MLSQKIQKYFLLCSLAMLMLPITALAQTPAEPASSIIPAPSQARGVTDEIAASGNGEVITSAWFGQSTLFVSIATLSGGTWQVQQTISQSGVNSLEDTSVAISDNGNIIAAGDPNQGQVFIYSRESATGMWSLASSITGTQGHLFGNAVALNDAGNILAVAASRDSFNTGSLGAVYIYEQSEENWVERTIIRPTGDRSLQFGQDVALNGNGLTLAVGVVPRVGTPGGNIEEVHLFSRAAAADVTMWGEPDIIIASDSFAGDDSFEGDGFGDEIALNTAGNILAVGASRQNNLSDGIKGLGAVYIFQRGNQVGSSWQEQQKIKPSGQPVEPNATAIFGTSIDLNGAGDRLVVGAPNAFGFEGATYLYGLNEVSGNWGELNIIRVVDSDEQEEQGGQVALNNDYLVTSEFGLSANAYQLLVVQLDSMVSDLIVTPESLSIEADSSGTVAVNLEDIPASPVIITVTSDGEGLTIEPMEMSVADTAVYTFTVTAADDIVSGEQILTFSVDGYVSKQLTVTIPLVTSIIPAPSGVPNPPREIVASEDGQVIASVWNTGNTQYVSIAILRSGTWELQQEISRLGGNAPASVAISNDGNVIVSGDPNQDQVFIYSRAPGTDMWSLESSISGTVDHRFGSAVALNNEGNILAVAAPNEGLIRGDNNTIGAVYIYQRANVGDAWMDPVILRPTVSGDNIVAFATDVALSGDGLTLAVGLLPLVPADATNPAAVHVYSRAATDTEWNAPNTDDVIPSDLSDDRLFRSGGFGSEIALNTDGDVLAVGVNLVGAVYIFQRGSGDNSWVEQPIIAPTGGVANGFGASIDLNGAGDRLVVGAPTNNGATYLYGFNEVSGNWSELNQLAGGFLAGQGEQVALNNEYLVTSEFGLSAYQLSVVELDSVISDLIIDPERLSIVATGSAGAETVEVNLESEPASPVTLTVTSNGEGLTISPKEVSVSDTTPQEFTVMAADDIVSGEQILTFSADGYASNQLPVMITNNTILGRLVLPDTEMIQEGNEISVSVAINPDQNVQSGLEATVAVQGQNTADLSFPQFPDLSFPQFPSASTPLQTLIAGGMTIEVASDGRYTGDREIVVTLSAIGYESATMRLTITDASSDTPPTITVNPNLSVSREGPPAELEVSINADPERMRILRVPVIAGEAITVSPEVLEFGIGETVAMLTVAAADALTEDTYEPYRISSVSFDIPGNPPEVMVLIDGQFNVVESTDPIFGRSIAISGNDQVMAVGTVSGTGSVNVYTNNGSGYWEFAETLTASNAEPGDKFGSAIAISDDGSTLAISAPEEDSTNKAIVTGNVIDDEIDEPDRNAGAVYIFTRGGNDLWTQQTYIKADNASMNANFGVSLSLSDSGDTLAVGANGETTLADGGLPAEAEGAVYLFRYDGTSWSQANYLKLAAVDISTTAEFGTNVALSGDGMTLAVGNPSACPAPSQGLEQTNGITIYNCTNNDDGIAHVFTSNSGNWSEGSARSPVTIDNRSRRIAGRSNFGSSVELNRDGTTLVVGLSNELVAGVGGAPSQRKGSVEILIKENDDWDFRQQITVPNGEDNDRFGADVTINSLGTVLAIGAPGDDSGAGGRYQSNDFSFDDNDSDNAGAVHMYRLNADGMYQHLLSLKPGVMTRSELEYGTAVSLSAGDRGRGSLAVGAAGLFEIIPYSEGLIIVAEPAEFDLDEGSSRTISVNLPQIGDTEVTVNLLPGAGLEVSSQVLTFSDTAPQNVVVTATDNSDYSDADRTAMVTLSATDYMSETVTVNIIEDDPQDLQPIDLTVPVTDLTLMALSFTPITVMVVTENVDLLVETSGTVSLSAEASGRQRVNSKEFPNLAASSAIMIDIFSGFTTGTGTVELTFSGAGLTTEVRTVTVSVEQGSLIINAVDTLTVNGNSQPVFNINITGSVIFTNTIPFGLEVEEIGGEDLVTVQDELGDGVYMATGFNLPEGGSVNHTRTLTRISGREGNTTLRVTATPSGEAVSAVIAAATHDISVTVNRPPIGLTVMPSSLEINRNTTEILTVSVPPGIIPTITIAADPMIADNPTDIVRLMENPINPQRTEIEVTGLNIGQTTLTITATATDHDTEMVEVIVEVVDDFNIEVTDTLTLAATDTLTLVEGETMDLSVGLTELKNPAGVVVNIEPTGVLTVSPRSLTFNNTDTQTLTVTAGENDRVYNGPEPRVETLTLTAPGYPMKIVTVNILDDELQPIGLDVNPLSDLSLVRFASTNIEVSVENSATLEVETAGAVSLSADGNTSMVTTQLADSGSIQVAIYGVSGDEGTVRFTVSGAGKETDTRELRVTVTRPTLVISEVSPSAIDLLTSLMTDPQMANLDVRVNAAGGESATITATVSDGAAVTVDPPMRIDVANNTLASFVVRSGITKENSTITITASHPDYNPMSVDVGVNVNLRTIDLEVMPSPLDIVVGRMEALTITTAIQPTTATITITVGDSNIITAPSSNSTYELNATTPEVSVEVMAGTNTGETTLRITATQAGYKTQTVDITVNVRSALSIETNLDEYTVMEGMSTPISVSLSRVDGGPVEVSYTMSGDTDGVSVIEPVEGLMFSDTNPRIFMVSVADDSNYIENRSVVLTFEAANYQSKTVDVDIEEDDREFTLDRVGDLATTLLRFETRTLAVQVDETDGMLSDISLDVETTGAVTLVGGIDTFDLAGRTMPTSIDIFGNDIGTGTVTFTVSSNNADDTLVFDALVVELTVSTPTLEISAVSPSVINLLTSETTNLEVTVSAAVNPAVGNPPDVTIMGMVTEGDAAIVMQLMGTDGPADMPLGLAVSSSNTPGSATITITVDHPEYQFATTKVAVNVNLRRFDLTLTPPTLLEVGVGDSESLQIEVDNASEDVSIRAMLHDTGIAEVVNSLTDFTLTGTESSSTIEVMGIDANKNTTLTVVAEAAGHGIETRIIDVRVLGAFNIVATRDSLTLTEGKATTIGVSLSQRNASEDVTVTIEAIDGMGSIDGSDVEGLEVMPRSIMFTDTSDAVQSVTVTAVNNVDYTEGGPREVQFRLRADTYGEEMVTVTIEEDDRSIELDRVGALETTLPRFATSRLTVRVNEISADMLSDVSLDVEATGAVTLADGTPANFDLTGSGMSSTNRDIVIFGNSVGTGMITFTVSSNNVGTGTLVFNPLVVGIEVSTPMLSFSQVSDTINLLVGGRMANLSVAVEAESRDPDSVTLITLTAMVPPGTENTATVSPPDIQNVNLGASEAFMVTSGNNAGDTTVTITASHPDYEDAIANVRVNVREVPSIEAVDMLSVAENSNADISVSLSRIDGADVVVTAEVSGDTDDINGVTVTPQSQTFSTAGDAGMKSFTVEVADNTAYRIDRRVTLTFTATDYMTKTVMVDITEDDRSFNLDIVGTPQTNLLRFATSTLTVQVTEISGGGLSDVILDVETTGAVTLAGGTSANFDLTGSGASADREIEISDNGTGMGMVTFTVRSNTGGTGTLVFTPLVVGITVSTPALVFSQISGNDITRDTRIDLEVGGTTVSLSVAVGVESGDASGGAITLTTAVTPGTGDPVTVNLAEMTDVDLETSTPFMVTSGTDEGTWTITITARHPNYMEETVTITVNVTPQVSQELRFRLKVFLEGAQ